MTMTDNVNETMINDLTPFLPHKIDRSRATYFTHQEQLIMLENFEIFRAIIKAKGNTAVQVRAREECWKKIAESVNSAGSSAPRTWQQIKTKYKNLIQSAHRRKKKLQKETSSNDRPRILETLQDCIQSDSDLGSPQELFVRVDGDTMVLVEPHNLISPQTPMVNGEAVPDFSETPLREPENMQPEASTPRTTKSKEETVEADHLRALRKKNIELDNIKKELEIKKLKLEIEKLEYEKKMRQISE